MASLKHIPGKISIMRLSRSTWLVRHYGRIPQNAGKIAIDADIDIKQIEVADDFMGKINVVGYWRNKRGIELLVLPVKSCHHHGDLSRNLFVIIGDKLHCVGDSLPGHTNE
jgi:hypothetical protein